MPLQKQGTSLDMSLKVKFRVRGLSIIWSLESLVVSD